MAAFLILTLGSGIGTAAEIFVQSGDSIQTAIDNATSGDVIILEPGTYNENVVINTDNLVIKSESGNPEDTIIKAKSSSSHVFALQADNVQISGLQITGTKNTYTGIYLSGCNNCIIDKNKILNNGYGIYLLNSKGNMLSNNEVTNNGAYGILFSTASSNTLSGNKANNNERGIHIGTSDGNTLSGNTISSNDVYGLYVCPRSDNNRIFNNYFSNTVNAEIKNGTGNAYYTEKTEGTNIVGGPYVAGNFWGNPDGTGFSDTAVDVDGDRIADSAYQLGKSIYADRYPLVSASKSQQPVLPVANFEMSTSNGSAPLSVQFTDLSENAVSWSWGFESDRNVDSTEKNPVYEYTNPGTYTVNLTVGNENGTASKTATVTVTQAAENNSGNNGTGDTNSDTNDSGTDESENDDGGSSSGGSHHSSGGSSGRSGGGASLSPEPAKNVEVKEISQVFITNGNEVKFDLTNNATCVVYVGFDAKKTVGKTTTIVEMLKNKSTLVSGLPSGEVYRFLNIWVGNNKYATSKNIENPIIYFKVEKSWLQNNSIKQSSIILNRYNDKKWEQLPTSFSGEDDKYLYFTAETSGFSFFAITGKVEAEKAVATISQPASQSSETGKLAVGTDSGVRSEVEKALEQRANMRSPGFETVYGVISLLALFLYKRK